MSRNTDLFEQAASAVKRKDYTQAIDLFTEIIGDNLEPANDEQRKTMQVALFARGGAYQQKGNLDLAENDMLATKNLLGLGFDLFCADGSIAPKLIQLGKAGIGSAAVILQTLGTVYFEKKDWDLATQTLKESSILSQSIGRHDLVSENDRVITIIKEMQKMSK